MKRRPINRLGGLALLVKRGQSDTFSAPLSDAKRDSATTDYLLAVDALVSGEASPEDFRTAAVMINVCNVLAIRGFGQAHAELIWEAFDALYRIQRRRIELKKFGVSGDDIKALRDIAELIEEQAHVVNVADITAAHDEMNNLLERGKIYVPK